ncbi:MAG TPA: SusC/RagA family TonB-linked outer membrane protein [Gemmatimonadaceae bacterium]|nr:SusC/RagA family TonB-linked outer membrane protein [Gemmatimonadaceae bacterium]
MSAPSSMRRWLLVATAALGVAAQGALAQATGTIRGRVTDAATQRPISDVQIAVTGANVGAASGADGAYTITNVPAGARTVQFRRIGYAPVARPVTITAGAETRLDVTLAEAAFSLDQVVVTGTAQATTKRTLGNAVTQINAEQLTKQSSLANVTDLLQSKSPGVTLVPGSGTAGTAADIRIRGTSSLSGSNRPIFFIDGVRVYDGPAGNFGPSGAGDGTFSQGVSALDLINADDIESIEVIKGPAAATLYGADAAGGVIQIITKKGVAGQQKVRWNFKGEAGGTDWALPMRTNYTTCTQARIDETYTSGANAGKPVWPGCQGLAAGTVISGNPLQDDPAALRTGAYRSGSLSARGGGERFSFYASGDYSLNEGVFHNNHEERWGGRANFTYQASEKLDFGVNAGYTRQRLRLPLGDDAGGGIIISATRGQPGNAANDGRGWRINTPELSNEYNNQLETDRYITSLTLNYRPASWFRNRFTTGIDYSSPLATIFYAPFSRFSSGDFPNGYLAQRMPQSRVFSFDYAGTIANTFLGSWSSEFTVGAQGTKSRTRTLTATASGLPSPDFKLIQSATTVNATSGFSEQASLGYYVQEQIGYADRVFVTGALRADDNSAFGKRFDRVVYPKASVSYVISEEPAIADFFRRIRADELRFRAAYGQAGRAPGPYDALQTYTSSRVVLGNGQVQSGLIAGAPGNENLKPEKGTETEIGLDGAFLGGRAGVELTYYDKRTSDALVSVSNAPSLGYTAARYINFGEISNKGVELALFGTPVKNDRFTWETRLNYSTNKNQLEKLSINGVSEVYPYNPYAPTAYPTQIIKEGYPIAGFWGVDVKRKPDGSYDTDSLGKLQAGKLEYVGPSLPTYEGAWSNTFTLFKDIRVYALIDFKGGNYLFNQKDRNRDQSTNRNSKRFNDPDNPLSPLDSAYWSGTQVGATRPWIQPADFVKLRDVSISYTLPERLTSFTRAQDVTFTLAGHNLGFISKKYPGIDPEVNFFGRGTFYTGTTNFVQFVRTDSYTLPMTRRFTASVNVNF